MISDIFIVLFSPPIPVFPEASPSLKLSKSPPKTQEQSLLLYRKQNYKSVAGGVSFIQFRIQLNLRRDQKHTKCNSFIKYLWTGVTRAMG